MARDTLIGTRIRDRRTAIGMKQADLARAVGISPSYLNLIEHNRRNIGGKLLVDIADELKTDVAVLSEGAEATIIDTLRSIAADHGRRREARGPAPDVERVETFIGRFPGWAAALVAERQRAERLERTVAALTDRMSHDPFLSASLHDVISTVTAIRSTATILTDEPEIEPVWRTRFHKNLYDDSLRLAEGAQALVAYLDGAGDADATLASPQDEFETFLAEQGYHIGDLERALPPSVETLVARSEALASTASQDLAARYLARYAQDVARMPLDRFTKEAASCGFDPATLAERFNVDLAAVFRRLASLPPAVDRPETGLVVCDGSGTITFRKPLDGFSVPRFGAACPLWPLYQALTRPMTPIREVIEVSGRSPVRFLSYAVALSSSPAGFDGPQVFEAAMLVLPAGRVTMPEAPVRPVGTSCRICPRARCVARREPSLLGSAN